MRTFRGRCHTGILRGPGHVVECDVDTTDPALFVLHMHEHGKRLMTPSVSIAAIRRMWRAPRPKPFTAEPFERGDWITWDDHGTTRTGQVWACHTAHTRWIADGVTFHDVHRSQLIENRRSAAA